MTFGEYWDQYFEQKKLMVRETTLGAYYIMWDRHLKYVFADVDMDSVKNSTLQNFVNQALAAGKKMKTVQGEIMLLKNMMKLYAISLDKRFSPPIVTYPAPCKSNTPAARDKYSDIEIKRLVEFCRESQEHWHKSIALVCVTGLRIGEVCGLRFSDFDFLHHMVHVQRTVSRVYYGHKESVLAVGDPKTLSSDRTVPIPQWLSLYYKKYKDLFKMKDESYICSSQHSPFIEPRVLREKFIKLCKSLGIKYRSFHSIRHSYASRLLQAGVDIRTAAELLGHTDVAMTLNIYSHSDDSAKMKAAKKVFV